MRRPSLWQDRRGAISAIFGIAALAFFGLVGMATEAGTWYLAHRAGQNAADASAIAGAMTLTYAGNDSSTETVVRNTATRNGYTTGGAITVSANHPPTLGAYAGNNSAVEAIVDQTQIPTFSNIFGLGQKTVRNRAVAVIYSPGNACVLALTGQLTINGTFTVTAPQCMLASNDTTHNSGVVISNNPTVNVDSITAVRNCSGCVGDNVATSSPATSFGEPTKNPFEALNTATWPNFSGATCDNTNYGTGSAANSTDSASPTILKPTYSQTGNATDTNGGNNSAYCGRLVIQNNEFVDFKPGTYFFKDADISISGTATVTCSSCASDGSNGVQIVQTGTSSNTGLSINGGNVTLTAGNHPPGPGCTTACAKPYSDLAGVLYYRDINLGNGGGTEVRINGNTATHLSGGFYFPGADADYNGTGSSTCTVIVGGSIGMSGAAILDQSGCTTLGLNNLEVRVVKLVE